MKKVSQDILGLTVLRLSPSSLDEFAKLVGGQDEVVALADQECYFRKIAPKVRALLLDKIKEAHNLTPRAKEIKLNPKGEEVTVYETDGTFLKWVRTQVTDEALTVLAQAAADEVGYDISTERSGGPAKQDVDAADRYFLAVSNGQSTWERIATNFYDRCGITIALEDDGAPTKENMADACRRFRIWQSKQELI